MYDFVRINKPTHYEKLFLTFWSTIYNAALNAAEVMTLYNNL